MDEDERRKMPRNTVRLRMDPVERDVGLVSKRKGNVLCYVARK